MARYISLHTLACLTRQGAEELARKLHTPAPVTPHRTLWNLVEGKMLAEFEASDRDTLEKWLKANGFHYDWLLRVEYESANGGLVLCESASARPQK